MARLPQPGGDAGNWGDILNDYLSQAHTASGTLKDDSVGASQLKDNAVTASALADSSVTAATIADNTIQEAQLAAPVKTKLNTTPYDGTIEADTSPFSTTGTRPWMRKTKAKKNANTTVEKPGELIVDDEGNIYGTDGVTQTKDLSPVVTRAVANQKYAPIIVPTGTSDDAPTINAALLANQGRVTKLRGDFTIGSSILVPSNTTFDSTDATITAQGSAAFVMIRNIGVIPTATGTGSITAGSTTLTTAVAASVGQSVTVQNADASGTTCFTANITAVGSGTLTLSLPAKSTVTNQTVKVFTRNRNIKILAGKLDRGNLPFGSGIDTMITHWRFCDGLTVDVTSPRSVQGKYVISLGGVTDVWCRIRDAAVNSDGVHITGPADVVNVDTVTGTFGDDVLAITANDWPAYGDTSGDVTNVTLHNGIIATTTTRLLKIIAGAGCTVDGFINNGTLAGSCPMIGTVWLGDDTAYTSTVGGKYGVLNLGTVAGSNTNATTQVWVYATGFVASRVRARISAPASMLATAAQTILMRVTGASSIKSLEVSFDADGSASGKEVNGLLIDGTATVGNVTVTSPAIKGSSSGYGSLVNVAGNAVVSSLSLLNPMVEWTTSWNVVNCAGAAQLLAVIFIGGYVTSGKALVSRQSGATWSGRMVVTIAGLRSYSAQRIGDLRAGTTEVHMSGLVVDTPALELFSAQGGNIELWGDYTIVNATVALLLRSASETIRAHGFGISCDLSKLAKIAGDVAINNNSSLSCGVGPVICDGTNWKNLFTAATY